MSSDIKYLHKIKAKNGQLQNCFGQQQSLTTAEYSYEYANGNSITADWTDSNEERNGEISSQILGPKTPLNKLVRRGSYPRDPSAEYLRMEIARLNAEINELRAAIHANVHYGRPFMPCHISMNKSQTGRSDNNVFGQLATTDNDNGNDNHNDDNDNDANDETDEGIRVTFPQQDMAAQRAATYIYYPTFKNECRWFLLMLFSYLSMCIPINVAMLVLVGWRPFFYGGMWIWSFPVFLMTIIFGHFYPFLKRPSSSWRRRTYFRPNFPLRLCVYWAITALLSFLIIAFLLGRHYLLGVPPQLTTSPEAIFPSTLGLECRNATLSFTAADDGDDEKVPSNQTLATDEIVAHLADVLGDDDEAKEKMHKCIKKILDDALGDDEAKKGTDKCDLVFFVLLIFGAFIVSIVDFCFSSLIAKM